MEIKPYFWAGRFYNHKRDSIVLRLSKAAWCLAGKIARKSVMKKYCCSPLVRPDIWKVQSNILDSSFDPVITWIGHSTFLIQVGGVNIITDPVFFNVAMFAKRVLGAGIQIDKLPKIDVVIVSHNHCDHMDISSLKVLSEKYAPQILVPYGNKKWLERKGLKRITEMTWGDVHLFSDDKKFTFLPAVHWTSRGILDINTTLWGSWMIECEKFKIYFAGDTAYSEHFKKISKMFSKIDVALMPIGPVQPRNFIREAHTCPFEAVQGFLDLDAKCFIPMHWGTFKSAYESFSAPADGLIKAWNDSNIVLQGKLLKLLKIGESVRIE